MKFKIPIIITIIITVFIILFFTFNAKYNQLAEHQPTEIVDDKLPFTVTIPKYWKYNATLDKFGDGAFTSTSEFYPDQIDKFSIRISISKYASNQESCTTGGCDPLISDNYDDNSLIKITEFDGKAIYRIRSLKHFDFQENVTQTLLGEKINRGDTYAVQYLLSTGHFDKVTISYNFGQEVNVKNIPEEINEKILQADIVIKSLQLKY